MRLSFVAETETVCSIVMGCTDEPGPALSYRLRSDASICQGRSAADYNEMSNSQSWVDHFTPQLSEPLSSGGRALPCYDTSLLTISVFIKRWDNLTLQSFQIRARAVTLHRCLARARAAQSVQYKLKIMIASLNLNVFITINFLPKLQIALIIKFPTR